MPRPVLIVALAIVLALAAAGQAVAAPGAAAPSLRASQPRPVLVAFRGGFHLGGLRTRSYGYGYRGYRSYRAYRPRSSLLHRVVKTAIWLYVLHLFFSHGGLSVLLWIVIIAVVLSLARHRRRYAYGRQSSWR